MSGGLYPVTLSNNEANYVNESLFHDSIISLVEARANVKLDESWFQFLSDRFPINKHNFKLIYKQNKLLMQ